MNIHEGLDENFKYISSSTGICLNHEEKIRLEIALNNLHLEIKSDEMWFWGKIIGVEKDYYIAVAIFFREHLFPKKKFFFCSSLNFIFGELPEIKEHHLKDADLYNTYFIGNPDVILKEYEDQVSEEEDLEDSNTFKPVLKLKIFTESDRLSYVIRSIDFDTSVVPEGAFKMLPINELRRNDNFKGIIINIGLNSIDLSDLSKFQHFRQPYNKEKLDLIATNEAIFKFNFMDSLDQDRIKGNIL